MAEEAETEVPATVTETERENSSTQDMDLETLNASDGDAAANGGEHNPKRPREEGDDELEKEENGGPKKQKVEEKSVEEQRLDNLEASETVGGEKVKESGPVKVGAKNFGSSVEMFDYFYKFLHYWPPNLNVNKYEHLVLLELLKKGHLEPEKKIGKGIRAFQVRYHPQYKSRCFFLVREDESVDDFSFRKCVDHILPLPENIQIKSGVNMGGGSAGWHGGKGGGRRGGGLGRGHGRGRKSRN